MKKFAAILSLVLCLAFFAACGEIEENTKPVISGFADTYTVKAGEEFERFTGRERVRQGGRRSDRQDRGFVYARSRVSRRQGGIRAGGQLR